MAERNDERLDRAITDVIEGRVPSFTPELASLLVLAGELRDLPDPRFAERLRREFLSVEENEMKTAIATSVRPYFIVAGADQLIAFLQQTFDAEVLARYASPEGGVMHAELRIDDSIVEMSDASGAWKPITAPLHVYVSNVEETYRRAVAAGAETLFPPTDQPYGDREAGITDPLGTQWFISQYLGSDSSRRPGFAAVNSGFRAVNAEKMLAFLQQAFGAVEIERSMSAGVIQHAEIQVGETLVELSEAHGQWGPTRGAFHLFVENCDAVYESAVRAGGTSLYPPEDKPYGERSGAVEDPFGNQWFIGTPL